VIFYTVGNVVFIYLVDAEAHAEATGQEVRLLQIGELMEEF
jgi:hypothetical protein